MKKLAPFVGVDGEGCGRNRNGQQHYMLLRAGEHELFTGKPLTTLECLEFICNLPKGPIYVGFSFGYDTGQILRDMLRDLPHEYIDKLFAEQETFRQPIYYGDFAIDYLPRNYLRVWRAKRKTLSFLDQTINHESTIKDSSRTIYETFGFFQQSFLSALQSFDVGREHWEMIERNKAARDIFVRITREIREYNRLECELLAELMERFRAMCHANGIYPRTWNGAGKLSAYLHERHGTITAGQLDRLVPAVVLQMARDAYYGGRFEVARVGEIAGPVYEADIRSAYPAAMRELPCLLHGGWEPFDGTPPCSGLYVAYVAFSHPKGAPLCGLPIRKRDGTLFWPREGQGVYWSPEIRSAERAGATVTHSIGWRYVCNCECRPFDWVQPLFEKRRALERQQAGSGYPLKLGLNSLYGKLAQRIGNPRWGNFVWAGLITAITRARLNDATRNHMSDVLMIATDALFSRVKLPLDYGDGLGQWEQKTHRRLFIVQPGLYFGAARPKTRGVSASIFINHVQRFERDWQTWAQFYRDLKPPPVVGIDVPLFVGIRLAHARGKPETACRWVEHDKWPEGHPNWAPLRKYSFDWSGKRDAVPVWETSSCVRTLPAEGAADLVSVPHSENTAWSMLNETRMEFEEQRDWVDKSPP